MLLPPLLTNEEEQNKQNKASSGSPKASPHRQPSPDPKAASSISPEPVQGTRRPHVLAARLRAYTSRLISRQSTRYHDLVFSGRPPLYGFKKISYDFSSVTIAPYGEYWREIRKIVVLEKRIQSFGSIRVQEVASMLATICRSNRRPLDLSSLVFSLSNNVVCRVAFGASGVDGGRKRSEFQGILHELQGLAGEVNLADYFPGIDWINRLNGVDRKLDKVFRDLDGFFDKIIEEHLDPMRPESDVEDLIDVLIRIQNDPCQTITLTNKHIKAVLIVSCNLFYLNREIVVISLSKLLYYFRMYLSLELRLHQQQ